MSLVECVPSVGFKLVVGEPVGLSVVLRGFGKDSGNLLVEVIAFRPLKEDVGLLVLKEFGATAALVVVELLGLIVVVVILAPEVGFLSSKV